MSLYDPPEEIITLRPFIRKARNDWAPAAYLVFGLILALSACNALVGLLP